MVSLMTSLWQLIIPMVVLSHFSASLPSQERSERHADGLFHSELSKMNGNAYVRQLVRHLVGLKDRAQRHADGLFTSELSKRRASARAHDLVQSLLGHKRSSPGLLGADVQGREEGSSREELCSMLVYQSFLNSSHSAIDAREAAAIASQYICPFSTQLAADMKEDTESFD